MQECLKYMELVSAGECDLKYKIIILSKKDVVVKIGVTGNVSNNEQIAEHIRGNFNAFGFVKTTGDMVEIIRYKDNLFHVNKELHETVTSLFFYTALRLEDFYGYAPLIEFVHKEI